MTVNHHSVQTAIVQTGDAAGSMLPLVVSTTAAVPAPLAPDHVLVRILAVALNPIDHKMPRHFPDAGATAGGDFCGIVETDPSAAASAETEIRKGTRVCGLINAYSPSPEDKSNGAFAEYAVADVRLLLRVPQDWTDVQAAALGGTGWSTLGMALFGDDALALPGRPGKPLEKQAPVLVYGAGTATGTLACQLLKLSGYAPVCTASAASAALATRYGAAAAVNYASPKCADDLKKAAAPFGPLRHALDCITDPESAAVCFAALGRTGGQYVCLEAFDPAWHTRKAVRASVVLAYEQWGRSVAFGDGANPYSRPASPAKYKAATAWTREVQALLDAGRLETHPVRELPGRWEGVLGGLEMLRRGEVRGCKLAVRLAD